MQTMLYRAFERVALLCTALVVSMIKKILAFSLMIRKYLKNTLVKSQQHLQCNPKENHPCNLGGSKWDTDLFYNLSKAEINDWFHGLFFWTGTINSLHDSLTADWYWSENAINFRGAQLRNNHWSSLYLLFRLFKVRDYCIFVYTGSMAFFSDQEQSTLSMTVWQQIYIGLRIQLIFEEFN